MAPKKTPVAMPASMPSIPTKTVSQSKILQALGLAVVAVAGLAFFGSVLMNSIIGLQPKPIISAVNVSNYTPVLADGTITISWIAQNASQYLVQYQKTGGTNDTRIAYSPQITLRLMDLPLEIPFKVKITPKTSNWFNPIYGSPVYTQDITIGKLATRPCSNQCKVGDVNCDGLTDSKDLSIANTIQASNLSITDNNRCADVDNSGKFDVTDWQKISNVVTLGHNYGNWPFIATTTSTTTLPILGLICPNRIKGDVNGDDKVDALDIQLAINISLNTASLRNYPCADRNNDGLVNKMDIDVLVNCILSLETCK